MTPQDVTVNLTEQTLTILWSDGHRSPFPLDGLRRACPCVECWGGHANMGQPIDLAIFKQPPTRVWRITKLETAGNYALQIHWDDGHSEGLYSWQNLRKMCQCETCQQGAI